MASPTNQRKTVVDMLLEANLLTSDQLLQAQDAHSAFQQAGTGRC